MASSPSAALEPLPIRHPLGLPAGSVRGVLTLMILGLVGALIAFIPRERPIDIPPYLFYLMFLIVGSFFAAHGHSISGSRKDHAPLYLPRGTLRFLIVVGFIAVVAWSWVQRGELPQVVVPQLAQPYLPLVLLAAFFLGHTLTRLVTRPFGAPPWFHDFLAWVSLLAVLGLVAEGVIQLSINLSLAHEDPLREWVQLPVWQTVLSAIIGFYFGARS